jgi:hypothetical protein
VQHTCASKKQTGCAKGRKTEESCPMQAVSSFPLEDPQKVAQHY